MKRSLVGMLALGAGAAVLVRWYSRETVHEAEATVHLQSEHEHFHLHVDLPPELEPLPGDTLHILADPPVVSETHGEVSYPSRVRLFRASWLRRNLVKSSSLIEMSELVEHP